MDELELLESLPPLLLEPPEEPWLLEPPPQLPPWEPRAPVSATTAMPNTATARTWRSFMLPTPVDVKRDGTKWAFMPGRIWQEPPQSKEPVRASA
ncbi:hypothetical protein GCM10010329_49100 [Streptomyces spiroverticillatus]|uniref:Uncharacterized protein n=1 Tax=Streptomyces finlayi TaxID=67296 RepID=A0A918X166_9ACTN|nr:hypothetical protein GCM10010329_49100 [Streptomyces spiroverticillatus]GHD02914.1 hypothetical protein GCM10010334_50050 [Streptomyces finlayi]